MKIEQWKWGEVRKWIMDYRKGEKSGNFKILWS